MRVSLDVMVGGEPKSGERWYENSYLMLPLLYMILGKSKRRTDSHDRFEHFRDESITVGTWKK